ncbi:LuxR C-terminal-related transcriptional regulator [Neptunitalea lumnitzerae]|uniref:HTH luxR-type domain-containing protein n=1 Tax=Neptunitalea lumnitzerae TaxID=2965509 RepID=A0ABQ5MGN7_9FLAO|nr:LuxR C-terminal-related transcriptional regulator [Neptunitalea sp. Y10]GLB48185.1 hypothetical protein Y10_05530 [Neptunitalea sp. Y10]
MNTKELIDSYSKLFQKYDVKPNDKIRESVERMKQIDQMVPPIESFFALVNLPAHKFEFMSKNFEHNLGYSLKELHDNGSILFLLSKMHLADAPIWLKAAEELMQFIITKVPVEKRSKISISYNFRIMKKNGTYVNILEHISPLLFDENNVPIVGTAFYTLNGSEHEYPIIGSVKYLNEKNGYETLFYKNFSSKSIENKLTNREIDIIRQLALGKTSKEIGDTLFISSHTVDKHRRNLLKKMNFKSTGETIQYFKDNFLL